jgi:type VI secretion system protein ImpA
LLQPIEPLVQPLPSGDGAGDDLTYDKDFLAFSRASAGTPERGVGDAITPAEDPDWQIVAKLSLALFQRTHDVRVAVQLARCWLYTEGLAGLAQGIELIRQLLTQSWDAVHPRADEDGDLTTRFNSLSALSDEEIFLKRVRTLPLAKSRPHGQVSLRDGRLVSGRLKLPADSSETPPDRTRLDAVFADAKLEDLQAVVTAARTAGQSLSDLQALIDQNAPGRGPELGALKTDLKEISVLVGDVIARRSGLELAPAVVEGGEAAGATQLAGIRGRGVASRADVVRVMDAICAYYLEHEPSSPVPMLITRAKRLVNLSFLEALRDLSPSTVSDLEKIAGVENPSN